MISLTETITIVAESPGLKHEAVEVVITIPTFKRPDHVIKTLESVKNQSTNRNYAIIVMDNDAEGLQGIGACQKLFESGRYTGTLEIAHARGNCNAYNAGWLTALMKYPNFKYLIVIDDDEVADPNWIENMCATAETFGTDIVGGPQLPVFEKPEHQGYARHPVFTPHYSQTGPVPIVYSSGNLLVSKKLMETMGHPFFHLQFNFMGGGDADLIDRSVTQGFKVAWCNEAPVHETVPPRRTESDWLRARSLRNGVISTLVERRQRANEPFGRVRTFAKSLALLAVSPFRAVMKTIKTGSPMIGFYHVYIGLGRVLGEFGYSNEQYRHAEKN
jgi:glycosyltransferase involved in cell wall biosynthesis